MLTEEPIEKASLTRRGPAKTPQVSEEYRNYNHFRHMNAAEQNNLPNAQSHSKHKICVESEIGKLKKVILHTPGPEVEKMTPQTASELLYNEIIHYKNVREAHAQLKGVLSLVSEVLEVENCLAEVLTNEKVRLNLLSQMVTFQNPENTANHSALIQSLNQETPIELAKILITGVTVEKNTLEKYLSSKSYSLVPLPNMYFMRDSSMVVGKHFVSSAMAFPVRFAEAYIMQTIFEHHPSLSGGNMLVNGCSLAKPEQFTIEGGDVLVINRNLLLIGISERTTPQAVDSLIDGLLKTRIQETNEEQLNVFCILLPKERSTIHLDMIFTQVNKEQAVVYSPHILGRNRARVVRMRVKHTGEKRFNDVDDLILGLRSVGVRIEPILCGGDTELHQHREQWNSGANMFAFAPGKVLSYNMHEHTVRACQDSGFSVVSATDAIANPSLLEKSSPVVVTLDGTELARGGGGPRCMTCPVLREEV
jgi:arginine deiminase